jgi:DNA-binding beta-propeller fold protein YncE
VHYCKPTSVAVTDDTNYFFVADGYCNSRIIKYSVSLNATSGHHVVQKVFQIGKAEMSGFSFSKGPTAFNIPHSLTLAEDKNMICVADRENGRIQCFNAQTGKFVSSIQPQEMGRTVYGISYAKAEGENSAFPQFEEQTRVT